VDNFSKFYPSGGARLSGRSLSRLVFSLERLRDSACKVILATFRCDCAGIAGREYRFDTRATRGNAIGELLAVDLRHDPIGQENVYSIPMRVRELQDILPVDRGPNSATSAR
jgi:hypothetical protein